jgi:hypothetical protein
MLNWHQQNALRQAYRLRNCKAHIRADDYIQTGRALCGQFEPRVHVDAKHAGNPANNVCAKCAKLVSYFGAQ